MNFEPSVNYLSELASDASEDMLILMQNKGVCSETAYTMKSINARAMSATACDMEAMLHRFKTAYRIPSESGNRDTLIPDIEASIVRGKPVITTIGVYRSFCSSSVDTTGVIPMPKPISWDDPEDPVDAYLGGLELCIVGYSRDKQLFTAAGYQGTGWGHGGFCYIPYSYVKHPNLGRDFVTFEF